MTKSFSEVKETIAVITIDAFNISGSEVDNFTQKMTDVLTQTGLYKTRDPQFVKSVIQNMGTKYKECTQYECLLVIGNKIKVKKLMVLSISKTNIKHSIHMMLLDIPSQRLITSSSYDLPDIQKTFNDYDDYEMWQLLLAILHEPTLPMNQTGVTLFTVPKDAKIYFNKTYYGKKGFAQFLSDSDNTETEFKLYRREYKTVRATVPLTRGKNISLTYTMEKLPKRPAFLLSLMWPGMGQFYQKYKIKGLIFSSLSGGLAYFLYDTQMKYTDSYNSWIQLKDEYNSNQHYPELWDEQIEATLVAFDETAQLENKRNIIAGSLSFLWTVNLFEIIF